MIFRTVNIGCKVNRVEVDAAAARLLARGARMAAAGEPAQVVLVNTCTVTGEADKKTRKAVRQALRANPDAAVLVTGCAAAMAPGWFEALDPRVRVVPKPELAARAWECLAEAAGSGPAADGMTDDGTPPAPAPRTGPGFRARVGVKAQDGCGNACTFCIVHVARGASRSVPLEQVVAEARAQARAGARELVLTGINLGAYDDGGRTLADLVRAVLAACPAARVRISSVEPADVDGDLVGLLARSGGRVCRHLHLPLQSGSSRVLAEMARPYDAEGFLGLVARLRAAVPQIALSTDIIAGFPGETEDDFQQTLDVARRAGFGKIHVFRYSRRAGTPAAARPDQVPPEVIAGRAHRLQQLGRELSRADAAARLGASEQVLVERAGAGTSESYHPVRWRAGGPAAGELVRVRLTQLAEDGGFIV